MEQGLNLGNEAFVDLSDEQSELQHNIIVDYLYKEFPDIPSKRIYDTLNRVWEDESPSTMLLTPNQVRDVVEDQLMKIRRMRSQPQSFVPSKYSLYRKALHPRTPLPKLPQLPQLPFKSSEYPDFGY